MDKTAQDGGAEGAQAPDRPAAGRSAQEARQAEALRANLRRRKQAKGRPPPSGGENPDA